MKSVSINEKAAVRISGAKTVRPVNIKRCPDCYSNIPADHILCPSCKRKLKLKVDPNGYARKPVNWSAYISCLVAWVGVVIYIWWAFFAD